MPSVTKGSNIRLLRLATLALHGGCPQEACPNLTVLRLLRVLSCLPESNVCPLVTQVLHVVLDALLKSTKGHSLQ